MTSDSDPPPTPAEGSGAEVSHLDAEMAYERGERCYESGDYDGAQACYLRVAFLRPEDADPLFSLGLVHYARWEREKAVTRLREALTLDPDHGHAHFLLGRILRAIGDEGWRQCADQLDRLGRKHWAMGLREAS